MTLPTVETQTLDSDFETNLTRWLTDRAAQWGVTTLLAHADDGIIWGHFDGATLKTSHDVIPDISPPLRVLTLQQLRLFGDKGEWLVWRDDRTWQARWVGGAGWDTSAQVSRLDEDQILWGTRAERQQDGFTVFLEDGQGFRHAVPLLAPLDENYGRTRRLRLKVRHYTDYNDDGEARIAVSRLVRVYLRQAQGGEDGLATT